MSARGPGPAPGIIIIRLAGEGTFLSLPSIDADALSEILRRHRTAADPAILKRNRGTLVTRVRVGEGEPDRPVLDAVVKEVAIPWRWRLIRLAGLRSPFAAHFETERRLAELGIRAPRTVAASLRPRGGREVLVTETLTDAASLRDLLWLGPGAIADPALRSALLRETGAWLREVHDRGVWQRDMKPGNVLVRRRGGEPRFCLVDVTAARFRSCPLDDERRARNLSQLLDLPAAFDREARRALLAGYLGEREGDAGVWEARVASLVGARRKARKRRTGTESVDEEYRRGRAMGKL